MGVKVYGFVLGLSATALLALYEKEVDFELVPLNIIAGDQHQLSHLFKQPFGMIPLLEDGDFCLKEPGAIAIYVADRYVGQGTDLHPQNPKDRALVDQWMEVESHNVGPSVMTIGFERFHAPNIFHRESNHALIESSMEALGRVFDIYEQRLATSKYLAGDFFSLADLVLIPFFFFMKDLQSLLPSRKHLKAWWEDISTRSAFRRYQEHAAPYLANLPPTSTSASA